MVVKEDCEAWIKLEQLFVITITEVIIKEKVVINLIKEVESMDLILVLIIAKEGMEFISIIILLYQVKLVSNFLPIYY